MRAAGEQIAMLTACAANFTGLADAADADCRLVGDSLGMVVQSQTSTVPVTLDEMLCHTRCVARGNRDAWLIGDLAPRRLPGKPRAGAACLCRADAGGCRLPGPPQ